MSRAFHRLGLCLVLSFAVAGTAAAQHRPHLGGHLLYNFDVEKFGIGAQFTYPVSQRLELYPSFDYFFIDSGSLWQLNGDLKYQLRERGDWFYVGGGIAIARASFGGASDSEVGANILAGWETLVGKKVHPYIEGRLTVGDGSSFQVAGGLNITIF